MMQKYGAIREGMCFFIDGGADPDGTQNVLPPPPSPKKKIVVVVVVVTVSSSSSSYYYREIHI